MSIQGIVQVITTPQYLLDALQEIDNAASVTSEQVAWLDQQSLHQVYYSVTTGTVRGSAAYQTFMDAIPISEDDVTKKTRIVVGNLVEDDEGSSTDHFVASTINGVPTWDEVI